MKRAARLAILIACAAMAPACADERVLVADFVVGTRSMTAGEADRSGQPGRRIGGQRDAAAFAGAGGRAQFIDAPAFGDDGHFLFSRGIPLWAPMVDSFLREHRLGARELQAAPALPALSPPLRLNEKGRAGFADYLAASPHKAFAMSPKGAFAYRGGKRTAREAQDEALAACAKYSLDCATYAIDDGLDVVRAD